jgi:sulfur-carrier protein
LNSVRLLYFAAVRELLHRTEEELDLPEAVRRVSDLVEHLERVHPELRGLLGAVRVAVNEEFADPGDPVRAGDVIALIPPVAGG